MLFVLSAIGAGPSRLLGARFDRTARLAMAPVLGLCLATCICTTALWFAPAGATPWLLPTAMAVSVAAALYRRRTGRHRRGRAAAERPPEPAGDRRAKVTRRRHDSWPVALAKLVLVVVAVSTPTLVLLGEHHSVGPVAYQVPDAGGYVMQTDGMVHESIRQAVAHSAGPWSDLVHEYWDWYAHTSLEMSADPVSANLDGLLGFGATDTQSAFMLAFYADIALGIVAVVHRMLRRPSWVAVFGASLAGGPFFLQLFFDGSEGAICGLALIAPLVVVASDLAERFSVADAVVAGILLAGLFGLYPLFLPPLVLAGALLVVIKAISRFRRSRTAASLLAPPGAALLVVAVAAILGSVQVVRGLRYLVTVHGYLHGQPNYHLTAGTIPAWLLQTRGFYDILSMTSGSKSFALLLLLLVVPVALGLTALTGWREWRLAYGIWPITLACTAAVAAYEATFVVNAGRACTYCMDRSLLPVSPMLVVMMSVGVASALATGAIVVRVIAALVGLGGMTAASLALQQESVLFSNSFFLSPAIGAALSHLPHRSGSIEVEAFDEAPPNPIAEYMLTYAKVDEVAWDRASVPGDTNENNSMLYVVPAMRPLPNQLLHTDYRYVLTRAPGIITGRRVIARDGAVALEERTSRLDVTLDYGFAVFGTNDSPGIVTKNPWMNESMQFVVAGAHQHTFVHLRYLVPAGPLAGPVRAAKGFVVRRRGNTLFVCGPARPLRPRARVAAVQLDLPANGQLVAMFASRTSCGGRTRKLARDGVPR